MCGINGIISKEKIDPYLIKKMNNRIIHRGPDGEGIYSSDTVQLGMRRLSIIDLTSGDQPIFNEDKRYVIVYNGEIYNFRELKEGLIRNGHCFYTNTDTEVIIHLYEEKKEACIEDLNGMFSFAIYDTKEKTLFIARDRLGKKPLYYYIDQNRFYFASELKSIIEVVNKKFKLSRQAIDAYFALTFIPAPQTIYDGIFKLESGSFLYVKSDLSVTIKKYWNLADKVNTKPILQDKAEAVTKVRDILFDSVEKRMISDVPFGAFLSGGVDSSIIVYIMTKLSNIPVKTFSIGNTLKCYDESQKARIISKLFKTEHTEWVVDNEYICSIVQKVLNNFDEPFADSSALPSFVVSELASKKVKVVLTGDGGDEIFAGYERYLVNKYLNWYNMLPAVLRTKYLNPLINTVRYPAFLSIFINKIQKITNNQGEGFFEQYHAMQRLGYNEKEIDILVKNGKNETTIKQIIQKKYQELKHYSDLARAMYTDISIGLEGDMLVKVDRTTMQNSIEARSPFLDYRLVEMSFCLSDQLKIRGSKLKAILKDAFKKEFPPGFLDKKKMGFGIPVGEFLMNELKSPMELFLEDDNLHHYVNIPFVKELFLRHCNGNRQTFKLWAFFVFALWLEQNNSHVDFTT